MSVNVFSRDKIQEFVESIKSIGQEKQAFVDACTKDVPRISTGSFALDLAFRGGLINDLYIMPAETSIGKSAIMMYIAQAVAAQGIDVLYFSLEMSKTEFIARAVAGLSFVNHLSNQNKPCYTTSDILYWLYDPALNGFTKLPYSAYSEHADQYFDKYGEHLHIIEGNVNGFCAKDIANIAAMFKKSKGGREVVVFVDYLQIINADPEDRTQSDRKTKADVAVKTLKVLASQIGMPVFTASSIGRSSYGGRVGTGASKESGDTEYTTGILVGWNWHGVTDCQDKDKVETEIVSCKKRGYRKMELDLLKFRNAERNQTVRFVYYPAYNVFFDEYSFHPIGEEPDPFNDWNQEKSSAPDKKIF